MSPEGFAIFVGKNNLQNEHLTFSVARPNDTFFHVKDFPGSHVVVQGTPLGEVTIRLAAKIAAYYSKARYSSSIPVDYTSVSHVKKLSGGPLGKVLLKKQKTIYIDIDEDLSSYLAEKR
jgi:predicted ribosome quality control (RQC) complex YloA/Tae2 family protein